MRGRSARRQCGRGEPPVRQGRHPTAIHPDSRRPPHAPATITPRNECIYQERYSGLPQQNAEGYPQGSPITFASRLRGDLLLVHGSGDDNVHFQGTEALINALVAAGKPLSMMEYPNRTHCICEGGSTPYGARRTAKGVRRVVERTAYAPTH